MPQASYAGPDLDPSKLSLAMRRRVKVFFGVFLVCLLISLGYNFSRSALYLVTARVQILPAGQLAPNDAPATSPSLSTSPSQDGKQAFLAEVEVLSSRRLLEKVVKPLQTQGLWKDTGNDPVRAVQGMLTVSPVDGTFIVQLQAQGT